MAEWQFERWDRAHARGEFCCGKAPLDDFLRSLVSQYEKRKLGRTYIAVRPGEKRVIGYYTVASSCVPFANLPPGAAKKLPKHPVPTVLLGRLAVDQTAQGQGLGAELLIDALKRCLDLSQPLGIYAIEVHAIDRTAKVFYQKFGFVPLEDNDVHLYLPLATVEKAFAEKLRKK
ncbi:MAG TPA: GNAT family N-acetyltransferase [Gemmataceae bacterium]|nr:GNAT family N-acetyltransferase [Gemmataceae bacterium]